MNFLKGLFGRSSDAMDVEETLHELPPARSQAFARAPTPAPAPAPAPASTFRLTPRYSTTVDFPAVLNRGGVDIEQQQRVIKAQELLRSLPDDLSATLKRQIVEAAFTAFDVPTQKIIDAASTEVSVLEAFIHTGGVATQKVIDEGTTRIAELDAEIAEIRDSMTNAVADQAVRDAATQAQIAGVKPIIGFFAQAQQQAQQQGGEFSFNDMLADVDID